MIEIHYNALCELGTAFPGETGPHFPRKKSPNGTVKYISSPCPSQSDLGTQLSPWVWSQLGRSSPHGLTWHFMYMHRKPGDASYPNFLFVLLNYKSSGGVCVFTLKFGTSAHTFLSTEFHRKIDEMSKNKVYSSCNFKTHQELVLGL